MSTDPPTTRSPSATCTPQPVLNHNGLQTPIEPSAFVSNLQEMKGVLSSGVQPDPLESQVIPLFVDCFADSQRSSSSPGQTSETIFSGYSTLDLDSNAQCEPSSFYSDIPIPSCDNETAIDAINLENPEALENIPVSLEKDLTIPYADVFDLKAAMPDLEDVPRSERQSWGDEDDGETILATPPLPVHHLSNAPAASPWDLGRYLTPRWALPGSDWTLTSCLPMGGSRARANSDSSHASTASLKRHTMDQRDEYLFPNDSLTSASSKAPQKRMKQRESPTQNAHTRSGPSSSMASVLGATLGSALPAPIKKPPLVGEHRLKISFIGLGRLGDVPQHFGKKRCRIPDGLAGTHELYNQKWQFEITHKKAANDVITINWKVINLASGTIIERTETAHEAFIREYKGQTICNQVLRDALDVRAKELEAIVEQERAPRVQATLQTSLRALRPRKCIMGLLFFGLLHQSVQENLNRSSC